MAVCRLTWCVGSMAVCRLTWYGGAHGGVQADVVLEKEMLLHVICKQQEVD